jgi:hypothetical protein
VSGGGLEGLRAALASHGGTVAEALADTGDTGSDGPGPAVRAGSGPRTEAAAGEYELLVEMILEGSRLHYGGARVVTAEPDLGLLLGDQLYALGLQRLAGIGDLAAVRELADVITLVDQAHAEGDAERAEAAWEAGATAIAHGSGPHHVAAKAAARAGDPDAPGKLRRAARTID